MQIKQFDVPVHITWKFVLLQEEKSFLMHFWEMFGQPSSCITQHFTKNICDANVDCVDGFHGLHSAQAFLNAI